MDLLLDVWREACRHVEIGEFVARIAPRLGRALPFDCLFVRRLDLERMRIETVAAASADPKDLPEKTRSVCAPQEMESVLAWCKGRELLQASERGSPVMRLLVPDARDRAWLAAPLGTGGDVGTLLLHASAQGPFSPEHEALLRQLLEPFSAALDNDRRFHELARLREAALADNQALLSRLGRDDISESIVGEESGLKEVMARVQKVAATDAPVLILGETGSGKEVIARAIHTRSARVNGPIVRVNCGAIPPELVDSELFGHEKGSFTGAINTHHGWFERADGGTLFLDEIGELPPAAQVRLLRILQDGSFERVGGRQSLKADVRLVAATHRQVEEMVAEGTFRRDLWYRISVFPIHLPALRERPGDIHALAAHFARSAGKRLGGAPLVPSAQDLELLLAYDWPGNVRELASVIERAAILGDGRRLELGAALGKAAQREPRAPLTSAPVAAPSTLVQDSAANLDDVVKKHIEEVLASTKGRIEGALGAAVQLGVNPHTLRARMRKLGIDWQRYRA